MDTSALTKVPTLDIPIIIPNQICLECRWLPNNLENPENINFAIRVVEERA